MALWPARIACAVFSVLALVMMPAIVDGQVSTADLEGTVRDESQALLPGGTVMLANQDTGLRRSTVSDENGRYRFPALPPGRYEVTTELQGFQSQVRRGIELQVGQSVTVDFSLKLSPVEETVTVVGAAALVETTRSTLGQVIETSQLGNLPLKGRNFQALAALVPGGRPATLSTTGRSVLGQIAFGAQSGRQTTVSLDGADLSDNGVGGMFMSIPLDAVREFQVVSNRFTAESGRSSGGTISVVSKSGTNQLHGGGYGFFRDKRLNWKNYFDRQRPKPDFDQMQVGGSIGGPIQLDKSHHFASLEYTNENTFANVNTQGAFPRFDGPVKTPYRLVLGTFRLDQQLGPTHNLSLRYSFHHDSELRNLGGFSPREAGSDSIGDAHSGLLSYTTVISSRALNEVRVHYGYSWRHQESLSDSVRLSYFNLELGANPLNPQGGMSRRVQVREDFSYFASGWGGEHRLKAGTDLTRVRWDAPFFSHSAGRFFFFHNNYPFDANNPSTWPNRYQKGFGDAYLRDYTSYFVGFYAQDDWKPRPNLTFNLGLRWEAETENGGQIPNAFTPFKEGESRPDYNNWGPRLGFVWDPRNSGRLAIRGGLGVYYYLTLANAVANVRNFDGSRYIIITVDNVPPRATFFTDPLGGLTPEQFAPTAPQDTRLIAPDYATPYTIQSSMGFSKQFGADFALDIDYVHILGLREAVSRDLNVVGSGGGQTTRDRFGIPIPRPFPQFRLVQQYETTGRSVYDGIQASLRKRLSRGHQLGVSYTLSSARGRLESGFGAVPNDHTDVDADYGYRGTDERHRVVVNALWELPWRIQISSLLSFATGRPYTLFRGGADFNNDLRPGDREPGFERNSERMANQFQADLRAAKDFSLGASRSLQIFFDTFNLTNRANFVLYNGNTATPATLRQPNQASDPRQMQLGLRVMF